MHFYQELYVAGNVVLICAQKEAGRQQMVKKDIITSVNVKKKAKGVYARYQISQEMF